MSVPVGDLSELVRAAAERFPDAELPRGATGEVRKGRLRERA